MKWSEEGGGRIHRGSLDIRGDIEADEGGYWSFHSCILGFVGFFLKKASCLFLFLDWKGWTFNLKIESFTENRDWRKRTIKLSVKKKPDYGIVNIKQIPFAEGLL